MGLAEDVYREVYDQVTATYGEDKRVVSNNAGTHLDIQLERPKKWFLRLDLQNPEQKYLVIRVSPVKALAQGAAAKPCAAGADTCMIEIAGIDDLQPLKPLILAAYHAMTISTGLLDPADVPGDKFAPPKNS